MGLFEIGAAGTEGGIKITADALEHVLEGHTIERAATAGRSIFAAEIDISAVIKAAEAVTPTQAVNGNLVRVVDAGGIIGTDVRTGQPTSIYTVVTDAANNLVTAHPGAPR